METLLNNLQERLEDARDEAIYSQTKDFHIRLEIPEIKALISLLKGGEWIPLRHEKDEIQEDVDVWLLRTDGEVVFSAKGDFIPIRTFTHYCIAKKPQPPTE